MVNSQKLVLGLTVVYCLICIFYTLINEDSTLPYMYKFLKDAIFVNFMVAWLSVKFSSSKINNKDWLNAI